MSPRRLLGWEPAEVTTFEYDELGRVCRSVTVREPEFSEWDVAVMLRDKAAALAPRGKHGRLLSEATDPANEYRYSVPLPTTDFAAAALEREQEKYRKQYPDAPMGALLWQTVLNAPNSDDG